MLDVIRLLTKQGLAIIHDADYLRHRLTIKAGQLLSACPNIQDKSLSTDNPETLDRQILALMENVILRGLKAAAS